MLTLDELRNILDVTEAHLWYAFPDKGVDGFYKGRVVPKGRPRLTKGGKAFTPKATKDFERHVRTWGKSILAKPVLYPVRVQIEVLDKSDDPHLIYLSNTGLAQAQKKDLDNVAKSICDGLNKVFYKDDNQIVDLHVTRYWSRTEGFKLRMERAGLTKTEQTNMKKLMRARDK